MKSNIKYRGLNSYVLSDKKTMLYKFAMIIILSSLMIVTIFSTIKIKISQSVTNVRYISEETGNDNINDSIEEENSADVNSDISNASSLLSPNSIFPPGNSHISANSP